MRITPRVLLLLAICLALAAGSPLAPGVAAQEGWYDLYMAGREAYSTGSWQDAEMQFKRALDKRPRQGRSIRAGGPLFVDYLPEYYLALVYVQLGRHQDALDLFDKVVETRLVTPRDPEFATLQAGRDAARRGNIDDFKERVVKIEVVRTDGARQTGTGIIVNAQGDTLRIVTALHVLCGDDPPFERPQSVKIVLFRGEDQPPLPAAWAGKFDEALDVTAIEVAAPRNLMPRRVTWEYRDEQDLLQKQAPVFTVGHAISDFRSTETNVVLSPADARDSRRFEISAAGIAEGASGGPVIDSRGYLIGMITRLFPKSGLATAVHVKEVLGLMRNWKL